MKKSLILSSFLLFFSCTHPKPIEIKEVPVTNTIELPKPAPGRPEHNYCQIFWNDFVEPFNIEASGKMFYKTETSSYKFSIDMVMDSPELWFIEGRKFGFTAFHMLFKESALHMYVPLKKKEYLTTLSQALKKPESVEFLRKEGDASVCTLMYGDEPYTMKVSASSPRKAFIFKDGTSTLKEMIMDINAEGYPQNLVYKGDKLSLELQLENIHKVELIDSSTFLWNLPSNVRQVSLDESVGLFD